MAESQEEHEGQPTGQDTETPSNQRSEEPSETEERGNSVSGDNTGTMISNVNKLIFAEAKTPRDRPVPHATKDIAQRAFCEPGGFSQALHILATENVVMICGPGAGCSLAGVRLLQEVRSGMFQILDSERNPGRILPEEIHRHGGYLLDNYRQQKLADLTGQALAELSDALAAKKAHLVIVAENASIMHGTAHAYSVELEPPDPKEVAKARIVAKAPQEDGPLALLDKVDLQRALLSHTGPARGATIADLLLKTLQGYEFSDIEDDLYRVDDHDIEEWFERNQVPSVRALCITAAFFEGQSYFRIATLAEMLTKVLENPEEGEIWPYEAPDLFSMTRQEMLYAITARLEEDRKETVRFSRPTWAKRIQHYVWREYGQLQPIIRDWLKSAYETRQVLDDYLAMKSYGSLLAEYYDFSWRDQLFEWASSQTRAHRCMAAKTLSGLLSNGTEPTLIRALVRAWAEPESPIYYRRTAAMACQGELGRRSPEFTLEQLKKLAGKADYPLMIEIRDALVFLFEEPSNRTLVLEFIRAILSGDNSSTRRLAMDAAMTFLTSYDRPPEFVKSDSGAICEIFDFLLRDGKRSRLVTKRMIRWARLASLSDEHRTSVKVMLDTLLHGPDRQSSERLSYYLDKGIRHNLAKARPFIDLLQEILQEDTHA
ncbi:hypothetical protein [Amycolatopsis magusensis]|uniref:hypothetical protein n=1 Tax=Amycolatopsis magusensis TaxID=882444 RepID=UPI0037A82BDB